MKSIVRTSTSPSFPVHPALTPDATQTRLPTFTDHFFGADADESPVNPSPYFLRCLHAVLALAFVYLVASDFDPLWIAENRAQAEPMPQNELIEMNESTPILVTQVGSLPRVALLSFSNTEEPMSFEQTLGRSPRFLPTSTRLPKTALEKLRRLQEGQGS